MTEQEDYRAGYTTGYFNEKPSDYPDDSRYMAGLADGIGEFYELADEA